MKNTDSKCLREPLIDVQRRAADVKDDDPIIPFGPQPTVSRFGAISRTSKTGYQAAGPVQTLASAQGSGTKHISAGSMCLPMSGNCLNLYKMFLFVLLSSRMYYIPYSSSIKEGSSNVPRPIPFFFCQPQLSTMPTGIMDAGGGRLTLFTKTPALRDVSVNGTQTRPLVWLLCWRVCSVISSYAWHSPYGYCLPCRLSMPSADREQLKMELQQVNQQINQQSQIHGMVVCMHIGLNSCKCINCTNTSRYPLFPKLLILFCACLLICVGISC